MATLLVVDDDEHIREFLRKSLSPHLTVVEAADGAQAVEAARWSHPQVVVMDLEMPVLDGYEAARQIKAAPSTGNPILIALTGALSENAVPRARAAGFSYFVRKEVNARNFVETIIRLVREASLLPPAPVAPEAAAAEPAPPAPAAQATPPAQKKARPARQPKKKAPRKAKKAPVRSKTKRR